ncbi:MAG: hypothetical protein OSJ83_08710 [Clostridia bacterium]|nr:hypothetical protein [Clostridia bacterium]
MQDFTIKELGELINSINKTPDAAIEVTADKTGGMTGAICGNTGLHLKITPYHPATDAAPHNETDDDV